jgi:hypothetical protein
MRTELTKWTTAVGDAEDEAVVPAATTTHGFQFIDLSVTSDEQKKRNQTIARSHAMKTVRGGQRRLRRSAKRMSIKPAVPEEEVEDEVGTTPTSSVSGTPNWQDIFSAGFAATMAKGFNSKIISPTHRVMLENDIGPLRTYSAKVTPALHQCIEFCKSALRLSFSNSLGKLFLTFELQSQARSGQCFSLQRYLQNSLH